MKKPSEERKNIEENKDRRHDRLISKIDEQHRENKEIQIEHNKKMFEKQSRIAFWTAIMAIATMILALGTLIAVNNQIPKPKLLITSFNTNPIIFCQNNEYLSYPTHIKIANVGSISSFDTNLFINYDNENVFNGATFVEIDRIVNETNPISDIGSFNPIRPREIGNPYWFVRGKNVTIMLGEIKPGESIGLFIYSKSFCGTIQNIKLKVVEQGHSISSNILDIKAEWKKK